MHDNAYGPLNGPYVIATMNFSITIQEQKMSFGMGTRARFSCRKFNFNKTENQVRAFFTTYNNCFAKLEILENGGSKADCQNSGLPNKMPSRSLQFEIGKA